MALDSTKWVVQTGKSIRYTGGVHGSATANYVTVLELHRWLQDLADAASVSADDFMDITTVNPSDKKFDTIITLTNGYTLDDAYTTPASEFIYGGSIIQGTSGVDEAIYDGIKVVANRGVKMNVVQNNIVLNNDFWNNVPDSSKTAATATVSGINSTGQKVLNVSDGTEFEAGDTIMIGTVVDEEYVVDSISSNALTLTENLGTATSGGEAVYFSIRGLNPDAANGVAMQFMVKIKTADANIDNTTLLFNTREWFKTYSEFRIPSTGRGVNVVPLTYAADLNNATASGTVAGWSTIANVTAGWNEIDVDNNSVNEEYYSEWDRNTTTSYTINQFYERMKYLTRRGSAESLYGLTGPIFRGITHSVTYTGQAVGEFTQGGATPVSWTGGTGQILADNPSGTAGTLYIQLLTGVIPTGTLTQGTTTATTGTVTEKTISAPFCGASTGSSLVGAYGFSLEYTDLAVNDKIQALDGVTRQPPNNVTFTVGGVASGYRVLVGPEDGSQGLKYDQLTHTAAINTTVTTITVAEAIPANTPAVATGVGGIRVLRTDGSYSLHAYTAVNTGTSTFTIPSTDFSGNPAPALGNVFITYIDAAASTTTISYNTIQTASQTLFIEARFGGTGPNYTDSIKPAKTTGTLSSTGGSATISPVSDA